MQQVMVRKLLHAVDAWSAVQKDSGHKDRQKPRKKAWVAEPALFCVMGRK